MKLEFPARLIDKNHKAVEHKIEATLEDGCIMGPFRVIYRGIVFELKTVNPDGTIVYHQSVR